MTIFSTRVHIFILNVWQAPATRMHAIVKERDDLKRETAVESTHSVRRPAQQQHLAINLYTYMCVCVWRVREAAPPTRLTAGGWKMLPQVSFTHMCINRNRSDTRTNAQIHIVTNAKCKRSSRINYHQSGRESSGVIAALLSHHRQKWIWWCVRFALIERPSASAVYLCSGFFNFALRFA